MAKGVLTTPAPGSTLTGASITFQWTAGTGAVTEYFLWVSSASTPNAGDLWQASYGLALTGVVTGLPVDGRALSVRLWTVFSGTDFQFTDYAYTACHLVPALVGGARVGGFRLGYLPAGLGASRETRVTIWLAGSRITDQIRVGSLQISDVLNDAPNSCVFRHLGPTAPTTNQKVRVELNLNDPVTLFSGTVQTVIPSYTGKPTTVVYDCSCIDDTFLANRRRPFGAWTSTSATDVAVALIETFATDLSTAGIEAGLPNVDIFLDGTEGMSRAFEQLANLVGGYFKFEDGIAFLFTALTDDPCDPIDTAHAFLNNPPISTSEDVSQLRNRVYGRGHGETVPVDLTIGETVVPLGDVTMFDPLGGQAIASTTSDGAPTLILSYAGIQDAVGGSLVGPGVSPSAAPTPVLASGSGLSTGVYQYAYTWVTAAGSTLPSPLGTVTCGDVADPSSGGSITAHPENWSTQAGFAVGDTVQCALSFSVDFNNTIGVSDLTVGGSATVPAWNGGSQPAAMYFAATWTPPALAPYAHLWISKNGAPYRLEITNPAYTGFFSPILIGAFNGGPFFPGVNRSVHQVTLSGIAVGPSGTTSRKIYRTAVNSTQLKLQQTIANNTATVGVIDATADGSLGANVPTSDTAGLTATTGQVNAGSATIPTAGTGGFLSTGGWVQTSSGDLVRYTGVSGNTLTGIPASGSGAILTTVPYGSILVPTRALTGVTGLTAALPKGARVHIWVQRDDTTSQDAQRIIDTANGRVRDDGVYEGPILVDERRGIPSLTALCDATLAIFSQPIQTVRYSTRDTKCKSGKPTTVSLASPPITADLVIQDVQISEIDIAPGLAPRFDVTASSTRFSFDRLLRKLTNAAGV